MHVVIFSPGVSQELYILQKDTSMASTCVALILDLGTQESQQWLPLLHFLEIW